MVQLNCFTFSSTTYLWTFKEKGVPDLEEDVAHHAVHKHHQEPVKGDEGEIHLMLFKMGMEPRQLLYHQVFEHALINLQTGNKTYSMGQT